jgi:hypothetical protein
LADAQYYAGQTVQTTFDFLDGDKVEEVNATFAHVDDPDEKFQLSGMPTQQTASEGEYAYWQVVLSGSVLASHKLGVYRCETIEATYNGGREVTFANVPDISFQIVEEDIPPPEVIGWRWGSP